MRYQRFTCCCLDQFLDEVLPSVSPNIRLSYVYRTDPLKQWWDEFGPPDFTLNPKTLNQYQHWLEHDYRDKHGNQPGQSTVRSVVAVTRRFLRWIHKTGRLPVDMSDWIPLPPKPRHSRRFLTPERCQQLIDAVPSGSLRFRDWAMLCFLLGTGARRFEAANALWEDTVIDPHTFVGHCHLKKTKGDARGRGLGRVVVFGPATGRALHQYRLFLELTGQFEQDPRIFAMSNTAIKMRFRVITKNAGFEVGSHDLRRTFADYWWEHNADDQRAMILLKLQLGHSVGEDVTLNHYINLDNWPRLIDMLHAAYISPVEQLTMTR